MAHDNHPGAGELHRFALIGRIASGLAHELNGPIGVAIGFTDLARETVDSAGPEGLDPARAQKLDQYLALIGDAGLRARSLTRLMWSFSKASPGAVRDFDIAETLAQASALAAPALKIAQIETRHEDPAPAATVARADPVLCLESIVELLLASPSALPDGGTVLWEAADRPDQTVGFTIRAEPWGETHTAPWDIPASVRETLQSQGGTIQAAESTGKPGHEAIARLPAGDPAKVSSEGT